MNNKIVAKSWFIMYNECATLHYFASIDYMLGDEGNKKTHWFPTYVEAYQWIKNQVQMQPKKTSV